MSKIIKFEDFNIILSLNDNDIYIKVTNNVTFEEYDGNITKKELNINNDYVLLNSAFDMINSSFNQKYGHNALIKIYYDHINISFDICVEDCIFKFDFNLKKKENVLDPAIKALNKKIEDLENIINNNDVICIGTSDIFYPILIKKFINKECTDKLNLYEYNPGYVEYKRSLYNLYFQHSNPKNCIEININNLVCFLKINNIVFDLNSIKNIIIEIDGQSETFLNLYCFNFGDENILIQRLNFSGHIYLDDYDNYFNQNYDKNQKIKKRIQDENLFEKRQENLDKILVRIKKIFDENEIQYVFS